MKTPLIAILLLVMAASAPVFAKENQANENAPGQQKSECRKMPGASIRDEAKERRGKPETPPGETVRQEAKNSTTGCGAGALPQDD